MKYSGIEWIGNIPDSWNLIRLKDWCLSKKEIAGEKYVNYERLALTLNGVVKRAKDDSEGLQPKEFATYQILRENDLVFKMIDLQNISTSRVGLSPYTGLVSPAYIRFTSRHEGQFNDFIYYYLMSLYYNCIFNSLGGDGVRSALNATDMGNLQIPLPKVDLQKKIVAAIKEKSAEIDALIEIEKKQTEKLKEYKQAVITEAVTKGLDKNAPMKDSGIDWIGEIPQSWGTPKLKMICELSSGGTPSRSHSEYWNGDINWVKTGELQNNEIFDTEEKITTLGLVNSSAKLFPVNTILMALYGQGKTRGMTGLLKVACATNQACVGIVVKEGKKHLIDIGFLWKSLIGAYGGIRKRALGSGQPNLSGELVANFEIPLPPIEIQRKIVSILDEKCAVIDVLIGIKKQKIEKLNEYKKSLIYEYVTGKKEVE